MSEPEFFAPWRIVGAFGDGARLTFDGLTEQQAIDAMDAAQAQHGDIIWWDRVTDVNYEDPCKYFQCQSYFSSPFILILRWASPGLNRSGPVPMLI